MSEHPPQIRTPGGWLQTGVPIALYNAAVAALIVHVASGGLLALRIAYLGLLTGAAMALVVVAFRASEIAGMARGAARRHALQVQAIHLGATMAYGSAGYCLYRSYQARFLVDGADLRGVPALVLTAIAITGAIAIGWVAWAMAQDRAADQRS